MLIRATNEWVEEIDATSTKWLLYCGCFVAKVILYQHSRKIHYKISLAQDDANVDLCFSALTDVPGEYESDEEKDTVAQWKAYAVTELTNRLKKYTRLALAGMPEGYLYGERC
jgi:hypothetical protein